MNPSLRSSQALHARIDKLTQILIQRFEDLISLAAIDETDYLSTAHNAYQTEVHTESLIRAGQDILTLTRQMQEAWLFGQLDTLGKSSVESKTDEDARAIAGLLEQLIKMQDEKSS